VRNRRRPGRSWGLSGNSGTTAVNNYIGTSDGALCGSRAARSA
jgi:hypothetical protein